MYKYIVENLVLSNPDIDFKAEKYAFFHSSEYENIQGQNMSSNEDPDIISGYLRLKNGYGKRVYRRYHGWHVKQGRVCLSYRTRCELGVKEGDEIYIQSSNWFCYYYNHSDAGIKWPFRIALYGFMIAIISLNLQLIF